MASSLMLLLAQTIAKSSLKFPPKAVVSSSATDLLQRLLEKDPFKRISWEDFFHHPYLNMAAHKSALGTSLTRLMEVPNSKSQ